MSNYVCEYARALLERAIEGGFQFLDGLAAVDACSMMNRFYEHFGILKCNDKEHFFLPILDVPYKTEDFSYDHMQRQLETRLLDAITPEGYFFFSSTVNGLCDFKIVFDDDFGVASSKLIKELRTYALASGYSVISSPNVNGEGLRHIIIKELSLGFFTRDRLCRLDFIPTRSVQLKRFYDSEKMHDYKARLNFSKKASKELLDEAVSALISAKTVHDELESVYIEAMDFEKSEKIADELIERIWKSEWWNE
jgi:hypothetical protein